MKEKIRLFYPFFGVFFASSLALHFYTLTNSVRDPVLYLQVPIAAAGLCILPILSILRKRHFPLYINRVFALFIFLSSTLGSACMFYHRFSFWDLLMHGAFGLAAAVILGGLMPKLPSLALFLSVMGLASLWEIFEFISDRLFGGDAQRVKAALSQNLNPVSDTMTDLMITIVGIAIFFLLLFLKKRGILLTNKA